MSNCNFTKQLICNSLILLVAILNNYFLTYFMEYYCPNLPYFRKYMLTICTNNRGRCALPRADRLKNDYKLIADCNKTRLFRPRRGCQRGCRRGYWRGCRPALAKGSFHPDAAARIAQSRPFPQPPTPLAMALLPTTSAYTIPILIGAGALEGGTPILAERCDLLSQIVKICRKNQKKFVWCYC